MSFRQFEERGHKWLFVITTVLILSLESCISYKKTVLIPKEAISNGDAVNDKIPDYLLRPGQSLEIKLSSENKKAIEAFEDFQVFRMDTSYTITMPTIGRIDLKGLTLSQGTEKIENEIRKNIFDAFVSVALLKKSFVALGEFNRTGNYTFGKSYLTIHEALAKAGGPTKLADISELVLTRKYGDKKKVHILDLKESMLSNDEFYYIHPGDELYLRPLPAADLRNNKEFFGLIKYGLGLVAALIFLTSL